MKGKHLIAGIFIFVFAFLAGRELNRNGKARENLSGELLFQRHCAACHGVSAQGDGPAADALRLTPTDLSQLKKKWGAKYSINEIAGAIDGRREIKSHGSAGMPVWGLVFEKYLEGEPHAELTTSMHTQALAEYLDTLQR